METGKPGLVSAPVHINSVAAQTEKRMDIQAPLTAVYIHTVPALPAQPYPQLPADARKPATLHLAMPPLYSKEMLPFLTLHIPGGLQSQPGLSLAAAAPAARPKSAGKHMCPHCGRDCMKPSVLEKHLRCHTGERPYPCITCGVSFKTQSNLYKHKRTQAHARLSSESEQSSLGSLDSMTSSRETCTSSLSLDERSEESDNMEKNVTLPAEITCPAGTAKVYSVKTQCEQNALTSAGHKTEPNESAKVAIDGEKQRMENENPSLTVSRHLPLQRQEATLFSKQWESSVSRGKSQSHESTDSGFSESSDHYPSPGSVLPDHSMDFVTESTKELDGFITGTKTPSEPGQGGQEPKDTAREQEQKTLEERISKLISENTAVVEDKQLENVRPRKTVLSKQGSIDLPMPYTYKDSFHFDMRISKTPNLGVQRNRKPGLYSSVPSQCSTTMEHAPLTRSNSLPFSVTLLQPEKSSLHPSSSHQSDYVTLVRRGSSGQINPTGFAIKPVNQQSSTHRPLVRQTAVDCNHATDGLFVNSSVEEASTGSLSCDGDGGDICGEPSNRKFRRKKTQKFAYNKWYMYGGGTFKKLYNTEKGGDDSVIKGRKSSTNPEHEAVRGLQKRLSAVQKETVTTIGSTANFSSSSATVCNPGCPPAKLPLVSAVDFNLKTSQLHTSCSSLNTPLRRNLSLSMLPLPSTGLLVSHKAGSMSRAEAGRLVNEEKQTDSSSQLCGANIPSDRKKQKTDDKIICPLEMEPDPNTLTHPPPSVAGSAPQQDANLSYINLQKNPKHTLFPPCMINANTRSVSTSPATSTPSPAKTSFLPKYQLKLPNAAEPDSNLSLHVADKLTGTDGCTFTSSLSSSNTEQTSPSVTASEKKCSVTSPLMQSCEIKKTNAISSAQGQLIMPCTAATHCQSETSSLDQRPTSSLTVVHRQFAATTITTTCLQDYQAGSCRTSIQPSKSAEGLLRPVAPVVVHSPATPTITTANNQVSAAAITAFSRGPPYPNPPVSHAQLSLASEQSSPVNKAYASSNTPIVPCHIVPFDQMQPSAQNVFHVHTADLQICLQIISDEQLALIEPQIERQAGSTLSPRCDVEAVAPEVIQNKAQSSVTTESSNEGRDHQLPGNQKEVDQGESLPTRNMERIKPPLSVQFGKAEPHLHLTENSDATQATVSAESKPPEALGLSRSPHKYGHVITVTESQSTAGNVMATALKGFKSGKSQTAEEEHALTLNLCAEEQNLLDRRVSQGGLVSQTLSGQRKLRVTSPSPSTVNQNSMRGELLGKESQCKLKDQRDSCHVDAVKAKGVASACESSGLESGETLPPLQAGLGQASVAACADQLSGSASSFSIIKCKAPRQLSPQASIYHRNPMESTLPEALNSFKQANMGCDRVGPSDDSDPSQEITVSESQDVISSAYSEKQLGPFTSGSPNIQVDRPKDSIQSPTAGFTDGASLTGCAAQKELQKWGTDWRPKQSQDAGETTHQCTERQGGGEVAGEDKDGGIKSDEVPGQWCNAEPLCRYTCLQDATRPEREDRRVQADSFENSWLSEQHLQHLSQTHSEMSEYLPQGVQQSPSTSDNLHLPASSSQPGLLNYQQPPSDLNTLYFSQQPWYSSIAHNQQTQINKEHINAQAQTSRAQNAFSQQDQTQTSITLSTQQGTATAGNKGTAVSHCTTLYATPSSTHPSQVTSSVQVSEATAGLTGDTQASNNDVLGNNTALPSKTYQEADDYQHTKDNAPDDFTGQSSNSGRHDIANKYQSFFLAGQLHGQSAEYLTSGVRPEQSCQDYTEDTSSSDDEGKLIIEL